MDFDKNRMLLLLGSVVFVWFTRFSAVISAGTGGEGSRAGPSTLIGVRTNNADRDRIRRQNLRTKLSARSYQIRTYADVANGTFFSRRTENYDRFADDAKDLMLSAKIDKVDQTYAKYMELHLYLLQGLCGSTMHPVFTVTRLVTNFKVNALDLLGKCSRSLVNNGFEEPFWMAEYRDLLNRLKFNTAGPIRIDRPLRNEFQALRTTLQEVYRSFDGSPVPRYSDVLLIEGELREGFLGGPHQKLRELREEIKVYKEYFEKAECRGWRDQYAGYFRDGNPLNACLTAMHFYQVGNNLVNLHVLLDMNKSLLPYE